MAPVILQIIKCSYRAVHYVPQVAPDREQKNDAAGVSVYGKIEIKKNTEE